MSRKYGISRVAIWKHIKALQGEGYPIESGHRGYKMLDGDNLTSMDFKPSENILFYRELTSTMREAQIRMLNSADEPEDFIILTDHQSKGIGREQSEWLSPRGGMYMTCVLNKPLTMEDAVFLPLRGILSVLQVLEAEGVEETNFLWPGDFMLGKNKIGGMLDEYCVRGGEIVWYALGMGIHINDSLKGKSEMDLSSIAEISGQKIRRKDFILRFRTTWEKNQTLPPSAVSREISRYALFLNKTLLVKTRSQGTVEGMAQSIDEEGCLNLISSSGTVRITAGESIKSFIGVT